MFLGSFDIYAWVAIIIPLWTSVIITFPFVLIWKGIKKLTGIAKSVVAIL